MGAVLITGGLGYIGAHMVLHLQQENIPVVVLDNNSYGRPNLLPGVEVVQGDIRDRAMLDTIFRRHAIDAVMHFAGYIQVGESVIAPHRYYDNNVAATLQLLDAVVAHKVKHVIFSSTAALYGDPQYTPIDELHPVAPLNPYGTSKWMIEKVLADYQVAYGLNYGVLRYFNAAGCDPETRVGELHEPETHLIPLILQVASGRRGSIKVYGDNYATPDGTCLRDFIHVVDLCAAHGQLLGYLRQGGEERVFNLGTGKGFSVLEVIEAASRVTGVNIPYEIVGRRAGDAAILVADGTKASQLLGWNPKFSELETIISHAWAWEKKLVGKGVRTYSEAVA